MINLINKNTIFKFLFFIFILLFVWFIYVINVDIYQNSEYKTGSFVHYENFVSKNISSRPVDVWLPEGYYENPDKKYPVIYLHDGQMMFNKKTSPHAKTSYKPLDWLWGGIFWDVDASVSKLVSEDKIRPAILVSIWVTYGKRAIELMPKKPITGSNKYISEIGDSGFSPEQSISDNYLKFIIDELKPYIDENYQTLTDQENTFIMGSSMGGLISSYAISEYPEIFGGAACLSTDWTIGKGAEIDWYKENWPKAGSHKIYFDFGTGWMDENYEPYQNDMDEVMRLHGYSYGGDWITKKIEGAGHYPREWRKRLDMPLTLLLSID